MFTGIISGKGTIVEIHKSDQFVSFKIELPPGSEVDLNVGASVSVDGVCLTATSIVDRVASFDVMQETLARSALGTLCVGQNVNIERSARDGAEIGGHAMSGHVDCTATITSIEEQNNNYTITFAFPAEKSRYLFEKGYVGLNGASLTLCNVSKLDATFQVWLIPETLRLTTFGDKKVGDRVNLEIERGTQVAVDTMRDFLQEKLGPQIDAFQKALSVHGVEKIDLT